MGIPDDDTGMIPPFAHPFGVFDRQVLRRNGFGPAVLGAAIPDWKLILNQDAFLIRNIVPKLGGESDAVSEAVPVHVLEPAMQIAHPIRIPGQIPPQLVFKEAVDAHIRPTQIINLAIEPPTPTPEVAAVFV